jgi:hypothetical protein
MTLPTTPVPSHNARVKTCRSCSFSFDSPIGLVCDLYAMPALPVGSCRSHQREPGADEPSEDIA